MSSAAVLFTWPKPAGKQTQIVQIDGDIFYCVLEGNPLACSSCQPVNRTEARRMAISFGETPANVLLKLP